MKKRKFPILEFDPTKKAIIEPAEILTDSDISEYCVLCFFEEIINKIVEEHDLEVKSNLKSKNSTMAPDSVYELTYKGKKINIIYPGMGAPLAAASLEELIGLGGRKFIACGGAGVLDKKINVGHLIIPKSAVRDEGVSYHYLAPSREVKATPKAVNSIIETLEEKNIKYITGKTWTTDAIYRETAEKIKMRKLEDCLTVEMEAAAFFSVAKFRDVEFGQILYAGDDVSGIEWNSRDWVSKKDIREKIFWLAVESCLKL